MSFRIRFSDEESACPAYCFGKRGVPRHSCDVGFPRSDRNRFVSGYAFRRPATDAPCRPAPIGRHRHRTLLRSASHQDPPAHGEGAFKSYSRFRGLKFRRHAHARISRCRGAACGAGALARQHLFADVLTTRDPTLVKRHDECSTSICHSESAPVHLVIPNPL